MNRTLVVFLDEHWPQAPVTDWTLLDAREAVLEAGRSDPRHWPAADAHRAVLGGAQCVWLELALPPAPRREQARLLAWALEAHLVRDPDSQHVTMTHRRTTDDGPRTGALVVARARLRLIVEQFAQLGRTLDHAHAALQTAAAADDAWVLSRGPGTTAVLRSGRHAAMALDAPDTDTLIPQLEVVVAHARRAGTAPRELRVHAAASDPPTDSHAIERRLEMAVDALPAAPWWPTDGAADLLHGEFAPRRRAGGTWSRLRRPATVALAAAAVLTLATVIDVLAQRAERDAIEARMARLLTDALPGAPTVAPPAQLARALADARRRHGELAPEDALSLLATHLSAGGAPPQRIDYQGGRLALDLTQAPDATLAARLDAAGVRTSVAGTRVTLEVAR